MKKATWLCAHLLVMVMVFPFAGYSQRLVFQSNVKSLRNPTDTLLKDVEAVGDTTFVTSLAALAMVEDGKVLNSKSLFAITGSNDFLRLVDTDFGLLCFNGSNVFLFDGLDWNVYFEFADETGFELMDVAAYDGYLYLLSRNKVFRYDPDQLALDESIELGGNLSEVVANNNGVWVSGRSPSKLFQVDLELSQKLEEEVFTAFITTMHAIEDQVFVGFVNGDVLEVEKGRSRIINEAISRIEITDIKSLGDSMVATTSWSGYVDFISLKSNKVTEINLRKDVGPDVLLSLDATDSSLFVVSGEGGLFIYDILWEDINVSAEPVERASNEVRIFPNPGKGLYTVWIDEPVELDQKNSPFIVLTVLNAQGSIVKTMDMECVDRNEYRVDLRDLIDGVYFLKVDGNNFHNAMGVIKL